MAKIKGLTVGELVKNIKMNAFYEISLRQVPKLLKGMVINDPVYYYAYDNEMTKEVLMRDLGCYDKNLLVYWTYDDNHTRVLVF